MKPLIFVIDADDVILSTSKKKIEWLMNNFKGDISIIENLKESDCNRTKLTKLIGHESYEEMTDDVYSDKTTLLIEPMKDSLESLSELSKIGKIYIVTARTPEKAKNIEYWLDANHVSQFVSKVVSSKDPDFKDIPKYAGSKKIGIAYNFGASFFVDDDLIHMPKEKTEGITCFLFASLEKSPNHIIDVKDWDELIERITYIIESSI